MKEQVNYELIQAIENSLPPKANLATFLIENLSISKEAAYRRLRGEVSFTFEEAAKIVSKLNISLDKVIGSSSDAGAIVNISMIKSSNDILNYHDTLEKYLDICAILKKDPFATLNEATNKLPLHLYGIYPSLTKFWISRWLHQSNNLKGTGSLDDVHIPEKTLQLHKQLAQELRSIPTSILIWDRNIFRYFMKSVLYFSKLNMVSPNDVQNIRKELFELLDELETTMATAINKEGGKTFIYLCNIPIETIYSYLESTDIKISMLRLYAINIIDSLHPDIFNLQKEWTSSLRRYSTLISDSSEVERIKYFDQQREYVDSLKI